MKPESWPGACQVTAHGKLKEGEDFPAALSREAAEELGIDFAPLFNIHLNPPTTFEISHLREGEKEVITSTAILDHSLIKTIRPAPETGGIRLVRRDEADQIVDLRSFPKGTGVPDRKTIAMFTDEKEAVAAAFARFS
jgi:8-oxo-dGTP pyrophosphatase MutT (NUDIX family)